MATVTLLSAGLSHFPPRAILRVHQRHIALDPAGSRDIEPHMPTHLHTCTYIHLYISYTLVRVRVYFDFGILYFTLWLLWSRLLPFVHSLARRTSISLHNFWLKLKLRVCICVCVCVYVCVQKFFKSFYITFIIIYMCVYMCLYIYILIKKAHKVHINIHTIAISV